MVFKLAVINITIALAISAFAATTKRIKCPDGKSFASNEAVSIPVHIHVHLCND